MTRLFRTLRFSAYLVAAAFDIVVLGLTANFAAKFLPLHRDFLIFSLTCCALTLVVLMVLALRSVPAWEIPLLFLLAIVWCGMGGFSSDVIGYVQCDELAGTVPAKNGTTYSSQAYCREMKVIEAFSWADFAIFTILFLITLHLTLSATGRGYPETWNQSISNLGWYGEETGSRSGYPYTGISQQQPYTVQPGVSYTYPNVQNFGGSQPVYQLPGHSVVITNGPHGQSIQQVPVVPSSEA